MDILDKAQRDTAQDPQKSCIVQAPAGSGKTTLLAQRYVRLLATVAQPEEILAITFTKKAAAEMRERVLQELEDSSSDIGKAAVNHAQKEGWQLHKYPGRLRIQTIDSFAMNLVQQLPVTSPLQQRDICAHPEQLYDQAVARVLRRVSESKEDGSGMLTGELLKNFMSNATQVHNLLVTMLKRREQWQFMLMERLRDAESSQLIDLIVQAVIDLQSQALEQTERLLAAPLKTKLFRLAHYAADNLDGHASFEESAPIEQWRFVANNLLFTAKSGLGKPQLRKTVTKKQGFPPVKPANPNKDELLEILADLAAHPKAHTPALEALAALAWLPNSRGPELDRDRLSLVGAVLFNCVNELNQLFDEHQEVDFNQITIAALTALGTEDAPSDLALSLDYKISHLLVDEFQDTSRAQHELFARLIREWTPGDGNSFFAVGDPMQSIYRFRNADVSLFLEICRNGMGNLPLEHLKLTTNFRSSNTMISWFNQVFETLLGPVDDANLGAISYSSATSPRGALETLAPDALFAPLKLSQGIAEQNEQIVLQLKQLLKSSEPTDIAILLRNRTPASGLVAALEAAGIPWQGTDLYALGNTAIVSDAVSLAQALFDPGDRVSAFALLRGPLVGLSLADLSAVSTALAEFVSLEADVSADGASSPVFRLPEPLLRDAAISADGLARVLRLQSIAEPLLERRLTYAPRELIEAIWLNLGGPAAYRPTTHKHVARLLDVIETGHPTYYDPERLRRDVDKLYAEDDSRGVQILTVHKSKGLQYKHVLVPYLQSRTRADEAALLMSRESSNGYLMAVRLPGQSGADKEQRTLYHWLKLEEQQRAKNEVKRLLYVAATRAEESLNLFGTLTGQKAPESSSLLGSLSPVFGELWSDLPPSDDDEGGDLTEPVDLAVHALPKDLVAPVLPGPVVTLPSRARTRTAKRAGSELDDPELLFSADRRAAILRGNLTHQALCSLSRASAAAEDYAARAAQLIDQEGDQWRQRALAIGLDESLADEVTAATAEGINRCAESLVGQWCALEAHTDSQAELPLTLWENSGPIKLIIDRTFVQPVQQRWIIDYKTSQPPADAQLRNGWLQAEIARYRGQLAGYARALGALHPEQQMRTALYFTAIDELWELLRDADQKITEPWAS